MICTFVINQIIIMQTALQYQFRSKNQKAVKYGLPGNMSDRYQQFDEQMRSILSQTEKCPFTDIRQLIIAFQRTDLYSTDVDIADILMQKYQADQKLYNVDRQLNACIQQIQNSQIRIGKLSHCVIKYNGLFQHIQNKLTQRAVNSKVFLENSNQYYQYKAYSQQFQRGITLASLSQSERFQPAGQNVRIKQISNFKTLQQNFQYISTILEQNYQIFTDILFNWRQKSKHSQISQQDFEMANLSIYKWKQESSEMDQIYFQFKRSGQWLKADGKYLREKYEQSSKLYQKSLPQYIKTKQIEEINSHNSYYKQLIRDEKKRLQDHLKRNYGLIVPYIVSQQFSKNIAPFQNPKNRELKKLIQSQLIPLEDSLVYVNEQYEQLYRQVCQDANGTSGVRKKIEERKKKFDEYQKLPDNDFALHLMESCGKLLRLAK